MPVEKRNRNRKMYELHLAGWTQVALAQRFGVSQPVVSKILKRERERAEQSR